MYINDLEQIRIDSHCGIDFGQYKMALLLYADDVILLSDSSTGLQNALDVMQNYSNRWKLKINVTKSKILVFKKGRRRANERWIYGNAEIQQTNSIPYLGIVFTQGAQWPPRKRHSLNKLWKQLLTFRQKSLISFASIPQK